MKNYVIVICFILFATSNYYSQWHKLPVGTDSDLLDLHFISPDTGWVVGRGSTILKTIDGGKTWISQQANIDQDIYSVFFSMRITVGLEVKRELLLKPPMEEIHGAQEKVGRSMALDHYTLLMRIMAMQQLIAGLVTGTGGCFKQMMVETPGVKALKRIIWNN
jgi:hypothetical protein